MARTPRKLTFDVIQETPYPTARSNRVCVLVEKSAKKWVPGVVSSRVRTGITDAVLGDGTHCKVDYESCRVFKVSKGDVVRVKDDSHSYTVVSTHKSDENTPFVFDNGDDMVELASRRAISNIKTPIKNLIFYDAENKPLYSMMRAPSIAPTGGKPVRATGSPQRLAQRDTSIIYNLSATPDSSKIFTDCVFVVADDFTGQIEEMLTLNGALTVKLLSDLLDLSDIYNIKYCGPPSATMFATIGHSISNTGPYLEALALGWPCLNVSFVEECILQNRLVPWQDYLLAVVSPQGFIKSQNCTDFKQQWNNSSSLEQQFACRSLILGPIITPLYVLKGSSDELLALIALSSVNFTAVDTIDQVPENCIFIDLSANTNLNYTPQVRLSMCRQMRVSEPTTLTSQWLISSILNQKLV